MPHHPCDLEAATNDSAIRGTLRGGNLAFESFTLFRKLGREGAGDGRFEMVTSAVSPMYCDAYQVTTCCTVD